MEAINNKNLLKKLADLVITIEGIEPTLKELKKAKGDKFDLEKIQDLLNQSVFPRLENQLERVKTACEVLQKYYKN